MIDELSLQRIAALPKGEKRRKLLEDEKFRASVLSSGANVTIYVGDIKSSENGNTSMEELLSDVFVGLIQRRNKKGMKDGLGALGGLAERTSKKEFDKLSKKEKLALVGQKDDVVLRDGQPILIKDIDEIRKNNVLREMREELDDLGIKDVSVNPVKLVLVPMPKVKDDNFMINIWDGNGQCFAISPYCHLYKDDEGLIDEIIKSAKQKTKGEVFSYQKLPLFKALGAYGYKGEKNCSLEDGRSADRDYRYPHEHLAAWALASELLEHDPKKMIALVAEVQESVPHSISFYNIAKATGQTPEDLSSVLGVSPDILEKMEKTAGKVFDDKRSMKSRIADDKAKLKKTTKKADDNTDNKKKTTVRTVTKGKVGGRLQRKPNIKG